MNKKIILFDPSICTLNCGDEIIVESAKHYITQMFPQSSFVRISTHMPVSNKVLDWYRDVPYRFVCGTNLLKYNMLLGGKMWDITYRNIPHIRPAILVGCGWWQYQKFSDPYSSSLWKKVLSKDYLHSVRDDYTLAQLKKIGITNVINTGCPTMWKFDQEFCKTVRTTKAANVVTTLTDYNRNIDSDQKMLNVLAKNYNTVYLWLQGYNDFKYASQLALPENISLIPSALGDYDHILETTDIEYIGTRLHGGIRALQHKKRTLILAVDNRAIEKKKDFNLNVIDRHEIGKIEPYIYSEKKCDIRIHEEEIHTFLNQFK